MVDVYRTDPLLSIDFRRLYTFTRDSAFFAVRARNNLNYGRRTSRPVDKTIGLRVDQTIALRVPRSSEEYPVPLRRISYSAEKTRVWIAISIYVLVAIVKKELHLERSVSEILQILSVTLFGRDTIYQAWTAFCPQDFDVDCCKQLRLFDY